MTTLTKEQINEAGKLAQKAFKEIQSYMEKHEDDLTYGQKLFISQVLSRIDTYGYNLEIAMTGLISEELKGTAEKINPLLDKINKSISKIQMTDVVLGLADDVLEIVYGISSMNPALIKKGVTEAFAKFDQLKNKKNK